MNRMISANTKRIPISRYNPNTEFRPGSLQPRSNGGCPAMDGMHAIGIHVIRETAAAADTRNDNNIFPGYTHCWHHFLHLRKYRIITATRAPAYFLVSDKIPGG